VGHKIGPLANTSQKVPADISEGRVAKILWCGGIFSDDCVTDFLLKTRNERKLKSFST